MTQPQPAPSLESLIAHCVEEGLHSSHAGFRALSAENPSLAPELLRHVRALEASGLLSALDDEAPPAERLGRYRLEEEVGRGGQAIVYRAVDEDLGRPVALKVLRGPLAGSADGLARLRREAELTSKLEHPGICALYEVSTEPVPFIAMRWIEGKTLRQHLESPEDGPLADLRSTLTLFAKIARALAIVHASNAIHRDIKPDNVMIDEVGEPVILDFGLARTDDVLGLTATREVVGTPSYLAPEQLRDEPTQLDARVDVWALGVTLYESLMGRRPFEGPTVQAVCDAIRRSRPAEIDLRQGRLPKDVRIIVHKCLEKERHGRYATASEVAADLEAFLEGRTIRASPPRLLGRAWRWAKRQPARATLLVITIVGLPLLTSLVLEWERSRDLHEEKRQLDLRREKELLLGEFMLSESRADSSCVELRKIADMEGGLLEAEAQIALTYLIRGRRDAAREQIRRLEKMEGTDYIASAFRRGLEDRLGEIPGADEPLATSPLDYYPPVSG